MCSIYLARQVLASTTVVMESNRVFDLTSSSKEKKVCATLATNPLLFKSLTTTDQTTAATRRVSQLASTRLP
jgi:hypothetical protein